MQDVLSLAGKLWNLTSVMRAGKYFVWHLLRLTGLHDKASRKSRERRRVRLGWEFHSDLEFWRWALANQVVARGESLSSPIFAHVHQPPARCYFSDASLDAIGGYCPERKMFWRHNLRTHPSPSLKQKSAKSESSAITLNTLELLGMIITSWVVQMMGGDKPSEGGQSVLMRGDNVSAVSWVNRCGGSRDRRACLLMRLLGRMEMHNGWCHVAKHIPGRNNVLAEGISRWDTNKVEDNVKRLSRDQNWIHQDIGTHGRELIGMILTDDLPQNQMVNRHGVL